MTDGINTTLLLPDRCRDVYAFEDIIGLGERISRERISILDLSSLTFIEPYSMLALLLLGRNHLRNTGERLRLVNIPLNIHQYLARMDFLSAGVFDCTSRLDEKLLYRRSSFSNRVIEVTDIPGRERESIRAISGIIAVFRKRARHILKYWLNTEIIDYFVTVISEVCQNIFEHSLDSGYCAMQTYSVGSEHVVRLVIVDSGIGIRESFSGREEFASEHGSRIIERALTTPISSKRRFGYGLCQVNAIIEKLKGSIYIRSGESSAAVLYNRRQSGASHLFLRDDLALFPGTQISISLFG
ncbi:MAG: sensor histidine kinase [Spirochaetes bacterium]|nr:sensor histidine kinase [Spirochaetota bacterium]